ncbi:MAG: hypothetical protein U1C48_06085 [Methylotenera sp.]|nr:hypothetical protein [Methylotenera sp.]MDZ4261039.1 hypothetical protein [Pseudomonadota bacterium]
MFESILQKILTLLVMFSLMASGVVTATENMSSHRVETGQYQQVKGINIYYGLLPAQIAGKHPAIHEERTMHGGVPSGKNEYHLIVALYDASGKRITDADVAATVGEFGMAGTRKALEPMQIGETTSFGNYFLLRGSELYRITIEIHRLGKQKPETIEALFDYHLQ